MIGWAHEIAIFSFHPIKNMTTGEGGMVVLDDDDLAEVAESVERDDSAN